MSRDWGPAGVVSLSRNIKLLCCAAALGGLPDPAARAIAQTVAQAAAASARAPECAPRPGLLGVSRIIEVDTSDGPRLGHHQYPDHDFLRDGEVVLTFDDGPVRKYTRMVLDALAAHCTRATFYMVGQMAIADPDMVREVDKAGHTIATHTWSHKNLKAIGAGKAQVEIELGISAVQRALGRPVSSLFRFPYLADGPATLEFIRQRQLSAVSIDADSKDYRTQNPVEMRNTLLAALAAKGKGILLMHDIQFSTAHGLRGVLDELAAKGYRIVHITTKAPAASQPRFDAMADAELARRSKVAATTPMAQRAVVWPMGPPGAPVEHFRPGAGGNNAANIPARPPAKAVASTPPAVPGLGNATPPTAAPPAGTVPPAEAPTPVLRGTTDDDDWRRRVFNN